MAFSTIQGSGSAPDSFVGTSGVDSISLATVIKPFILEAFEADDTVTFAAVDNQNSNVSESFLTLGDGNDIVVDAADLGTNFSATFINGNAGADNFTLRGVFASSSLSGGQGNDFIDFGFLGFNTPNPGIASSLVNGNIGEDSMFFNTVISNSTIRGGQGNDNILFQNGVLNSFVTGDLGDDTITIAPTALSTYIGSTFAGGDGNDTITAQTVGAGNATGGIFAIGEGGDDTITGSQLDDTIDGGIGDDNLSGNTGDDSIDGGLGNDVIFGGIGDDTINGGDGADSIDGGFGNDLIDGGLLGDLIFGQSGNDTINGGDGADSLNGGIGNDVIDGGNLDDIIIGDFGADTLTGGTGNNRFVQRAGSTGNVNFTDVNDDNRYTNFDFFTIAGGADVITDWSTGAINALDTGLVANANDAFGERVDTTRVLIITFSGESGNLWFRGNYDGNGTFQVNENGADLGVVTAQAAGSPGTTNYTSNFTVLAGAGGSTLANADFIRVEPLPINNF